MSFLWRVIGKKRRDRIRNQRTREELRIRSVLNVIENRQLKWFGHDCRMEHYRDPTKKIEVKPLDRRSRNSYLGHIKGIGRQFTAEETHEGPIRLAPLAGDTPTLRGKWVKEIEEENYLIDLTKPPLYSLHSSLTLNFAFLEIPNADPDHEKSELSSTFWKKKYSLPVISL